MKKTLFLLSIFLLPVLIHAQIPDMLKFADIGPQSTGADLVLKFGQPTKIDTTSWGFTYTYDIELNYSYDFGWVLFYANKEGKLTEYSVKVGKEDKATKAIITLFQDQFKMPVALTNLFNMDIKALGAELKKASITFGKPDKSGVKACYFTKYYGIGVTVTMCSGKLVDDERQNKLYQLDVKF